jgi:hypothetical protein
MGVQERREKIFQERRDWVSGEKRTGGQEHVRKKIFSARTRVPKYRSPREQLAVKPIFGVG